MGCQIPPPVLADCTCPHLSQGSRCMVQDSPLLQKPLGRLWTQRFKSRFSNYPLGRTPSRPHLKHSSQPRIYTKAELPVITELSRFSFRSATTQRKRFACLVFWGHVLLGRDLYVAEAIKQGHPMLGLRLPLARYGMPTPYRSWCALSTWSYLNPRLPDSLWDLMIRRIINASQGSHQMEKRFMDALLAIRCQPKDSRSTVL
jgi:hypothetical protein